MPSTEVVVAGTKAAVLAVGGAVGAPEVLAVVAGCVAVGAIAHFLILKPAVAAEQSGATV